MIRTSPILLASLVSLGLAACANSPSFDRGLGYEVDEGGFGSVTRENTAIMNGTLNVTQQLQTRFAAEVPSTITFPFNSSQITPEAAAILNKQADWIRQFPELRFSVYGHADAVGSNAYNQSLGKRRAQAVVSYFAGQGINRNRLKALVSYGETRPVIATQKPEEQNRRAVTTVSGFGTHRNPAPLNGKYAAVIFREYVEGATRPHPPNTDITNQVNPGQK
jgi:peptidoglycan-associated lipoprotein